MEDSVKHMVLNMRREHHKEQHDFLLKELEHLKCWMWSEQTIIPNMIYKEIPPKAYKIAENLAYSLLEGLEGLEVNKFYFNLTFFKVYPHPEGKIQIGLSAPLRWVGDLYISANQIEMIRADKKSLCLDLDKEDMWKDIVSFFQDLSKLKTYCF